MEPLSSTYQTEGDTTDFERTFTNIDHEYAREQQRAKEVNRLSKFEDVKAHKRALRKAEGEEEAKREKKKMDKKAAKEKETRRAERAAKRDEKEARRVEKKERRARREAKAKTTYRGHEILTDLRKLQERNREIEESVGRRQNQGSGYL